jgi:hypothetical protein
MTISEELDEVLAEREIKLSTLAEVHKVFMRWLGDEYDLDALDIVLATAAVERLEGDPVWLLMLSGSGFTKTETVQSLAGAGGHVTSTITSEGALLSATSSREKAKDATGGLLKKIGDRGLLVVKDVTSILSMNKDLRAQVLAALREVYDGQWERNVGTDGGKTLTWKGRIVIIGAVTSEYDRHHAVISAMGDRFALVRVDSGQGRMASGRQALRNVGVENQMRAELSEVVGRLLNGADATGSSIPDKVAEALLSVANLVTLARTAVEKDWKGQVLEAHMPEAPTRFAKMLGQIVRGGLSLDLDLNHCIRLAFRVARDSLNPMRLQCLLDVADHPSSRTSEVTERVQKPRVTVDRYLQELHILGLLHVDSAADGRGWRYSLANGVDSYAIAMLKAMTGKITTPGYWDKEGKTEDTSTDTDFSGHGVEDDESVSFDDLFNDPNCPSCGKQLWPDGSCSNCRPHGYSGPT